MQIIYVCMYDKKYFFADKKICNKICNKTYMLLFCRIYISIACLWYMYTYNILENTFYMKYVKYYIIYVYIYNYKTHIQFNDRTIRGKRIYCKNVATNWMGLVIILKRRHTFIDENNFQCKFSKIDSKWNY